MENDIVAGLFGLTPSQVQQQQQAAIQQQAAAYARQAPFERAAAGMYQGGAGLAGIGAGMMGMVNPEEVEAANRQRALSQADLQTPAGILKAAEMARQRGDVKMQLQLQMLARQRMAETKKEDSPFAKIDPKDYTPESLKVFAQTKDPTDLIAKTEAPKAPPSRTRISGGIQIQEELQSDGTWKEVGRGERFAKQITGIGGGVATSEKPSDKLLNKDQRWVQKDGEFVAEIIPGSKTFNVQKGAYSADKDAVKTIQDSYMASKSKIDTILADENKSAFGNLFGGYTEKFVGQYLSGKTASVKQKLESLKSEMKASGLQIMRSGGGVGQITEREWKIMESMIDSIDPTMNENDARKVLEEIGVRMESAKSRAEQKFDTEWAGSQFDSSKPAAKGGVKFLGFE